jgi:hypothetical protein
MAAAGTAVASMLGLGRLKQVALRDGGARLQRRGDLFVVGGPNSTDESMVAFEYRRDGSAIRRATNPTLPLRWSWIVDSSHPAAKSAPPMGYVVDGWGPRLAGAWPLMETHLATGRERRLFLPEASNEAVASTGVRALVPRDNYLLVTKLVNFLDPDFDRRLTSGSPSDAPHILSIEGTHSIGTRSAELLTDATSVDALSQARRELHGATEFQLLFRAHEVTKTPRGGHRFTALEYVDCQSLEEITVDDYRLAHEPAVRRLHEIDAGVEPRPEFLAKSEID